MYAPTYVVIMFGFDRRWKPVSLCCNKQLK